MEQLLAGSQSPGSPVARLTARVGYGSVNSLRNARNGNNTGGPEENTQVSRIARRLRCIFTIITWPIVPMALLTCMTAVTMVVGFVSNFSAECSHPLKVYFGITVYVFVYVCFIHDRIRARLLSVNHDQGNGNTTSNHNRLVRRYEQISHSIGLLYIYAGVSLVQACEDDTILPETPDAAIRSTCEATCPALFDATVRYVTIVCCLLLSFVLPLLFLPCIYLWFIRQAGSDRDLAAMQERFREEEFLSYLAPTNTANDILNHSIEKVTLHRKHDDHILAQTMGENSRLVEAKPTVETNECCICMNAFIIHEHDLENNQVPEQPADIDVIVRTKPCGHLFHERCMASWVGGRWRENEDFSETAPWRQRRAKRTTCPLCRGSLAPNSTS